MHSIVGDCDCTTCKAVTVHARHSEICISKMLVIVGVSLRIEIMKMQTHATTTEKKFKKFVHMKA
jgi:hypothetical protein